MYWQDTNQYNKNSNIQKVKWGLLTDVGKLDVTRCYDIITMTQNFDGSLGFYMLLPGPVPNQNLAFRAGGILGGNKIKSRITSFHCCE